MSIFQMPIDEALKATTQDAEVIFGDISIGYIGVINWMMMSERHHPLMKYAIKHLPYQKHVAWIPYWRVIVNTGPLFVYRTLVNYPCPNQVYIYNLDKLEQFVKHTHTRTWMSWDGQFFIHILGRFPVIFGLCYVALMVILCKISLLK